MTSLRPLLPALLVALGCSVDAFVVVSPGPLRVSASLPVGEVPAALLTAERRLATVACDAARPCPSASSSEVVVRCEAGACALAPFALRSTSVDVDLDTDATFRDYAGALRGVEVQSAELQLRGAHPGSAVGPLVLWWGPTSEATPSRRLGAVPRTALGSSPFNAPVVVDAAGVDALEAHILGGAHRFRVRVDGAFEVGAGVLPDAQVELVVQLRLTLQTSL
ncbi:MAG: hypothetical protein EPO40_21720 [Myxococcaceae bacterium]|nr:MAG: hypothetical protein EPO40_21720 [Myxococcaceae bacterium]